MKYTQLEAKRHKDSVVYSFTVELNGSTIKEEDGADKVFCIQITDSYPNKAEAITEFFKKIEESYKEEKKVPSLEELLNG
jgi:protein-tyrosine phosphatase